MTSIALHSLADSAPVPVANVSPDFSSGRLCPRVGRRAQPSPLALNYPCDHVILMNRLLHYDAVILHACGVATSRGALLFCGASGAGKTTIARLWRSHAGARILNDDRLVVRVSEAQVWAAATPWHGEDPEMSPDPVPLRGCFLLHQAPRNAATPLGAGQALAGLMANAVAPFYSREGTALALEACGRAAEQVPAYALDFTPDERAVSECARVLGW